MYKIIVPLLLLAATSACVPVAPYGGGGYGGPAVQQPDIYDLPAHCYYNANQDVICN